MRITDMLVTPVAVYDPPLRNSTGVHQPFALRTIVQLFTDDGLSGVGETYGGRRTLEQLETVKPQIIGSDPWRWERLRSLFPPHIASPIECACLDIIGKATNRPVCEVLGGRVRDGVEFSAYLFFKYQGDDPRDDWGEVMTPDAMVEEAKRMVREHGFKTLKLKGGVLPPDEEIETLRLLRQAFPEHKLRIDPNAIWTVETSIRVAKAIEPLNMEYLEDPTEGQEGMAAVRKETPIPLSTNMCVTAWEHIAEAFRLGSVDVVLSDHHYWGGLAATKELGRMCAVLGWGLSMHSNTHLGVSLAAMVHAAAITSQLTYACDTHYPWQKEDIIKGERFQFLDGALPVPDAPGLGVEVDEEKLMAAHETYLKVGIAERNDVREMKRYDPTWKPKRPRW